MSSIAQVTDAISAKVNGETGLRAYNYAKGSITPPASFVLVETITPVTFALGEIDMALTLMVFTSAATDRAGQLAAYDYMASTGSKSVWRALYNNGNSMLLTDTSVALQQMRLFSAEDVGALGYYGATFNILASTSGA